MRILGWALCVAVMLPTGALAADTPTTKAITSPTVTEAASDSPLAAVQEFERATRAGDSGKMLAVLEIPNPHLELVKRYVDLAAASRQLHLAAEKHFGVDSANKVFHRAMDLPVGKAGSHPAEQIDGDAATVKFGGATGPESVSVFLKRLDGRWKIDAARMFRLSDADKLPSMQTLEAMTAAVHKTIAQVKADAFASPQAAMDDLRARLLTVVASTAESRPAATTAP